MERFFSLSHLTAEQLRSLYLDAVKVGKLLIEYDKPGEEGDYDINLPEDMILDNISPLRSSVENRRRETASMGIP